MEITYNRLKKIASEVRAELVLKGTTDVSRGKDTKKTEEQREDGIALYDGHGKNGEISTAQRR